MTSFSEWAKRAGGRRCPWCGEPIAPRAKACRLHVDLELEREHELRDDTGRELDREAGRLYRRLLGRRRLRRAAVGGSMAAGSIHTDRRE